MSQYYPWTPNRPAPPAPAPGLPAAAMLSPAAAISQMTGIGRTGVGQTDLAGGLSVGAGVVLVALGAVLSYYAGAAMAPSPSARKTWGLVGIPVGVLTGPWGLGVMGIVSLKK